MDSLTQIVLGASVAAAVVPASRRRAALLVGAALGTLPDLDVLPLLLVDDPVLRMTWHRGPSHSLLVLLPFAVLLWLGMWRCSASVRESPRRWLAAVALALGTHPLLDAHTVYGTQLLWPLPLAPTMWSTVFIIDPLYTLPLLAGAVAAWLLRAHQAGQRWLLAGLALSSLYLGWSWTAKSLVEDQLERALATQGMAGAPRFTVPAPFTTFVWRAVAMTPDGHLEGRTTPWRGAMTLRPYSHQADAWRWAQQRSAAAQRMDWFARGFLKADEISGELVLSDLRMGAEPDYFFRFVVARREQGFWSPLPPRQLSRPQTDATRLSEAWRVEPIDPASGGH